MSRRVLEMFPACGKTLWVQSTKLFLVHILLLSLFVTPAATAGAEESDSSSHSDEAKGGSAIVYVIDKSSSMLWVYDDLKRTLKEATRQSQPGDCISIILFGDSVTTLASYKSMDESKKEVMAKLLDTVAPNSLYTNLKLAVKRGTESLYKYFQDDAAESYTLVLVTDGKNHPSPGSAQEFAMEEAITQFPDFLPGKQWSLRYIALENQIDPELLKLVEKYGESFFDVEAIARRSDTTEEEVLGNLIEHPEMWEVLRADIVDHDGEVRMMRHGEDTWSVIPEGKVTRIYAGDKVAAAPESKAVISFGTIGRIGLTDTTEIVLDSMQKSPLKKSVTIQLRLEEGTLWNAVETSPESPLTYEVLTPIALTGIRGTVLRVAFDRQTHAQSIAVIKGLVETSPPEGKHSFKSFTMKGGTYSEILPGKEPSPPGPIPKEILREWTRWIKALVWKNPLSYINFKPVKVTAFVGKIVFGPIKPGKNYSEAFPIKLSEKYYGKSSINAKPTIDLPPGVELKVGIFNIEDKELEKNVIVTLACPPFLKYTGVREYNGKITLTCPDPDVEFAKKYLELQILQSPPSFFALRRNIPLPVRILIVTIISLLILLAAVMTWIKRSVLRKWKGLVVNYLRDKIVKMKLIRIFRARPIGQVVLREAPAEGGQKFIDLAKLSRQTDKIILGVGTDSSNPIVLPHASVRPFHCTLWAGRRRNPTQVYVEPCSGEHVVVNGEKIEDVRMLKDKDVIEIGECRLTFLDTQFRKQVEVHMKDRKVHKGFLELWDLTQSIFYMTQVSDDKEDFLALRFGDVSYVQFYRDESERDKHILPHPIRDAQGKRKKAVTIVLENKKKLQGFVHKKYYYGESPGVFLMPHSGETEIQYTYIPRASIEEIATEDSH